MSDVQFQQVIQGVYTMKVSLKDFVERYNTELAGLVQGLTNNGIKIIVDSKKPIQCNITELRFLNPITVHKVTPKSDLEFFVYFNYTVDDKKNEDQGYHILYEEDTKISYNIYNDELVVNTSLEDLQSKFTVVQQEKCGSYTVENAIIDMCQDALIEVLKQY